MGGTIEVTPGFVDELVAAKILTARPITYEDFLPFSAAGIFQSNLQATGRKATVAIGSGSVGKGEQGVYEAAMGCPVFDADQLYSEAQHHSIEECASKLGLNLDHASAPFEAPV